MPLDIPIIRIEINVIIVGNLPLHGTKLFVTIASNLSRGESIILHPTTPAALHPKPMHIVSDCLPQALQHANGLSKLKAIRGKTPKSSKRVKSGKNIAIGGSITETTQPKARKPPETSISLKKLGTPKLVNN